MRRLKTRSNFSDQPIAFTVAPLQGLPNISAFVKIIRYQFPNKFRISVTSVAVASTSASAIVGATAPLGGSAVSQSGVGTNSVWDDEPFDDESTKIMANR